MHDELWSNNKFSLVRADKGTRDTFSYYSYIVGIPSLKMAQIYRDYKDDINQLDDWDLKEFIEGIAFAYHTLTTAN